MTDDTTYDYSIVQFGSEDFWRDDNDGQTELTHRVNKEGESGWEFVRLVWHSEENESGFVAILRRPHGYYVI